MNHIKEQRARLKAQRDAETDPILREAYALAERAGFDWYDTESCARQMAEHAAKEIVALKVQIRHLEHHDPEISENYDT
jgi:hypothetical protein